MIKRFLIVTIILLLYTTPSYAYLTDTNVHARPGSPPAFNATTKKATDTVFGSIILRLTGAVDSNAVYESAETQNYAPIQHFANPWNCTGDYFVIWADRLSTGDGTRVDLYSFNPTTFTAAWVRSVGVPVAAMNYNRYISWSRNTGLAEVDRKWLLYAVNSNVTPNRVQRWNLDTVSAHDGLAANSTETIFSDAEGIQACTVDETDDLFAYWNNAGTTVKVYKKSTTTTYTLDVSGWSSFDEVQITPKGYVYVKGKKYGDSGIWYDDITHRYNSDLTNPIPMTNYNATLVYSSQTGNFTRGQTVTGALSGKTATIHCVEDNGTTGYLTIPSSSGGWTIGETITDPLGGSATLDSDRLPPDYFSGKHSGYGTNWVNESSQFSTYRLAKRNPANGQGTPTWMWTALTGTLGTIHPSYWGSYVYGGMFSTLTYDPTKKYLNEIIRVKDDATEVARLAHSWSIYYSSSYDEIPSFVDPTGNYVIFYSNWNGANSAARHDVFIVQINAGEEVDTTSPVMSALLPVIQQPCTPGPTANVTISLTTTDSTNPVTCKFDTNDTTYALMGTTFSTTGGNSHSHDLTGLACNASHTYYVRCQDAVTPTPNTNTVSGTIAFTTAASEDTTPPVLSSAVLGTDGRTLTITFNESVKFGAGGNTGFTITPSGGVATVVYSSGDYSVALVYMTSRIILSTETLTLSYTQPTNGVEDNAGNDKTTFNDQAVTNNSTQSPVIGLLRTLWESGVTVGPSVNDGIPIILGVRFGSTVAGVITGIRFYKQANDTGTHVGNIWTSDGVLKGSVTFTGETGSGWQQMSFATPIHVNANTLYIASYFCPTGNYTATATYFVTSGVSNSPLYAPQSTGGIGYNGVFLESATNIFPNNGSPSGRNFWVDIVYEQRQIVTIGAGSQTITIGAGSQTLSW